LIAIKGYGAPEIERVYTRARNLCQQVRDTPQFFPVLWGLWVFYLVRAEFQTARELAEQLLRLAQSVQDPALLLEAHLALGGTLLWLGELTRAREHLEQDIALYDFQQHRPYAFLYVEDPGVACLSWAAHVPWYLGYPDQALKRSYEALTLARELSHPYTLAYALVHAAWLHQYRREGQAAQELAEAVIALSSEQGFAFFLAYGTIWRGWALAEQGQTEEGIAQICQGLAAFRTTGAEGAQTHPLALLAEAYGKGGRAEEGLSVLAEALALVQKKGERWWEAELYRLKGELTLQQCNVQGPTYTLKESRKSRGQDRRVSGVASRESEAEVYFRKAIEVARTQQAKSWELRAAASLSRLWQQQGKRAEARQLLAEIYGWFTEGFDTKDLQGAKALLKELS
jgi:predicted ATPase